MQYTGNNYRRMGHNDEAENHFKGVLVAREECLGSEHPDTIRTTEIARMSIAIRNNTQNPRTCTNKPFSEEKG
jgi:hypothetical protein